METQTKEAFMEMIDGRIKEIDAQIDLINSKIKQMDAENRMIFQDEFDALQEEKETMKKDLVRIEGSGDNTWEGMKEGIEHQWEKFKIKVEDLFDRL
ncbi:MAG TPA: hypothetical protein VK255_02135 [Patescibacteria group bacterium]|nr:hypothetical protein [Patescibacteria group bacterium]